MKHHRFATGAAALFLLSGCATIVKGTSETIAVLTPPVTGAKCVLANGEGTWTVTTPDIVMVDRSKEDLQIRCTKPGYQDTVAVLPSGFEGWTAGSVLLGNVIGLGVDASTGAMNQYPHSIQIQMLPEPQPPAAAPAAPGQ
jgi:hypothetical protein